MGALAGVGGSAHATDSAELAEAHDDVEIVQISPDELPAIDIHSL